MRSSSVWGNIRGFTVTEYVQSRDSGIFRRWWAKVVSPYNSLAEASCDEAKFARAIGRDDIMVER